MFRGMNIHLQNDGTSEESLSVAGYCPVYSLIPKNEAVRSPKMASHSRRY
jgi:hypothetical protein